MGNNNEVNLVDYWDILRKNKKKIIIIILLIMLITLNFSLIWPKTYESNSIIQLASIEEYKSNSITQLTSIEKNIFFSEIESKIIIQSSIVLSPIINNFFTEEDKMTIGKFNKNNLKVELIKETVSPGRDEVISYLKINVKSKNAQTSKEINKEIINQFFNYVNPVYEKEIERITEELSERGGNIQQLKSDIAKIENDINSLSSSQLSSEGVSKSILLKQILVDYRKRLAEEEDKKINIEKTLNSKREYKIISYPETPLSPSKPKILLNLLIALILGLIFSIFLAFFQEAIKRK